MKIVFAGTPLFAAAHLAKILDNGEHDVIGVYTQPDRPSGRGKRELPSAVKSLSLKSNLLVHQPLSLNNAEEVKIFKNLKITFFFKQKAYFGKQFRFFRN